MTRSITASEANQAFSSLLRRVQQGEDFIVTSRGRAIARVIPYAAVDSGTCLSGLMDRLEKLPNRSLPGWSRDDLYS